MLLGGDYFLDVMCIPLLTRGGDQLLYLRHFNCFAYFKVGLGFRAPLRSCLTRALTVLVGAGSSFRKVTYNNDPLSPLQ